MISLAYVMIRGYYLTKNEIVHKLRIEVASYMAVFSQKALEYSLSAGYLSLCLDLF